VNDIVLGGEYDGLEARHAVTAAFHGGRDRVLGQAPFLHRYGSGLAFEIDLDLIDIFQLA
jgi:hypothetical protein